MLFCVKSDKDNLGTKEVVISGVYLYWNLMKRRQMFLMR